VPFPENSTVIVAHGAWADGSSWKEVILALGKQGLQVVAAPLPLTSLSDDITVQRPIALKCIQEPAPKPAWRSKPSWFLIGEEDRMINPKTQHFMAKRMRANSHAFAVDHTPLLTAPEKVMEVIMAAAQETLS
jgi:hypothetical protein